MNENRYAVGVDIGTSEVRVVVAAVPSDNIQNNQEPLTIVGIGSCSSQGMRKGTVVDIKKVAACVDKAAGLAEEMCGFEIKEGVISINGVHLTGRPSHGLITVDRSRPIGPAEINRVVNAATQVKMSPNCQVIDAQPHLFKIDDQDGVRDPIDMEGLRLEVDVYMMTALKPYIKNLDQVCEQGEIRPIDQYMPAGLAASQIALSDQQRENGCIMIDIGHSTTNLVVCEDGDVIDFKVLPVGSANITNDLAIGLKTDLDIAERVKIEHAVASPELRRGNEPTIAIRLGSAQMQRKLEFETELIDEIVEARLDELFELINRELKRIRRLGNLPGGAVITGGGANLRGIADYAKKALGMNARIYKPRGYKGVTDQLSTPAWTTALGLVECAASTGVNMGGDGAANKSGLFSGLFGKLGGLFGRRSD
ncbi:MAG: cell division protein FtsA [Candidatus Saccharibacteria bacterium]|nr:cell division protein FtsA [Candidatus Saccharibacteria bacterium]